MTTTTQSSTRTLPEIVRDLEDQLDRAGILAADMRRAGSLETDVDVPHLNGSADDLFAPRIERLEGQDEILPREIDRRNETRFTWFLDGAQKTLPVWRVGVVPVIVGIAVVGILERDADGTCHLLGDSLREEITWFVPRHTRIPELDCLAEVLEAAGQEVRDPLESFTGTPEGMGQYQALAGNYSHLLAYAYRQASRVRDTIEQERVRFWDSHIREPRQDEWLVVDGRLPGQVPNAIGFVKDPSSQHLVGEEAATLYSLPQGHRTTAYQLVPRHEGDEDDDTELRNQILTMWYQRMWPATGLDARHSLVRLEAGNEVWEPDLIDDIATWLMAERVPRPTKDGRWPTLLYPIHQLELMLKRRIAALTVGWPS